MCHGWIGDGDGPITGGHLEGELAIPRKSPSSSWASGENHGLNGGFSSIACLMTGEFHRNRHNSDVHEPTEFKQIHNSEVAIDIYSIIYLL